MTDRPLKSKAGESMRAGILSRPGGHSVLETKVSTGVLIDYIGVLLDEVENQRQLNNNLLRRIKALEDRPELKYCGVWQQDQVYGAASFATDAGSLWHAQRASVGERPGSGDAWKLAVKKGRDGRDAK